MTREEIRLQVSISVIQGLLEAKHGVIGEVVPSVAVATALRIADAFVEEWYRETEEQKPAKSEDERIRKCIRLSLDECVHSDIIRDYERDECLAYLEKQKDSKVVKFDHDREPKPAEREDEKVRKEIINYILYKAKGVSEDQEHAWVTYLEKQKEQIPYIDFVIKPHKGDDNNPYDMRVSEAQEYAIKRGFGIPFNDGEVYVDERHMIQTIGNIIRWADEHPKEQKPAECIPDSVKFEEGFKTGRELGFREGVESVKPAEWSEEDEKIIQSLILEVNKYVFFAGIEANKIVGFLKSLRPSWKPSEEQLKAYHAILLSNTMYYTKTQKELFVSLYNDLKKL